MTRLSLIIRNLKYYRSAYYAILAGTMLSTAVLTGALIVGDSLRHSLLHITEMRLGKTCFAIKSNERYFRQQLASELSGRCGNLVAPLLQLKGIAVNGGNNTQINQVDVLGIDDRFLAFWKPTPGTLSDNEAFISQNVAEKLKLKAGDDFILKSKKLSFSSENAPFVSEKEPLVVFRIKVKAIVTDEQSGRFSLKSNQMSPFNIFVQLTALSSKLGLPGFANVMLVSDQQRELTTRKLDSLLHMSWCAGDAGLKIRSITGKNNYEIKSELIFFNNLTANSIKKSIPRAKPFLTYLVNAVSTPDKSTPYSFVTAVDSEYTGINISAHEIILSDWIANDLDVKPGDSVTLRYFKMGALRKLKEDSARFAVKLILPLKNPLFDKTLMPDFPGMSDAGNCRDWETGAPIDLHKIRDQDEQYWKDYRGTPKALISFSDGQKLFDNAFGHITSFRFSSDSQEIEKIKVKLISNLIPAEQGYSIQNVYQDGITAATNSSDFGELFLSLSFFIIIAALLLTALLFSNHARLRFRETAIYAAIGFLKRDIVRILSVEAAIISVMGGIGGIVAGIGYNKLMLLGLNTLWNGAVRSSFLEMQLLPDTLFIGFISGTLSAFLVMFFVLKRRFKNPLALMVKGGLLLKFAKGQKLNSKLVIASLLIIFGYAIPVYAVMSGQSDNSLPFLIAGAQILSGGILLFDHALAYTLRKTRNALNGSYILIVRNIGINRPRTITAVSLLAIGTFSVLITGANMKTFIGTENKRQSGTGGFLFWTESTLPFRYDLNTQEGQEKYSLTDEPQLKNLHFMQMQRLDGTDASCLNLNHVSNPAILGLDADYLDQQQSFSFVKTEAFVDPNHPWLSLNKALGKGIIPAYADQSVIQWNMHKEVGDTLRYTDESGKVLFVKIIGGLDNSIFQGNILISAQLFKQYFPSNGASNVMLLNGEVSNRIAASERLEYLFQDYGFTLSTASERLAAFNSVEDTYLSVFMMLGGLGMILGTIGLGIIMLRNLDERKQEIAIYKAIGFNEKVILKLILAENLLILISGVGIGIFAAMIGMLPSFLSQSFHLQPGLMLIITSLILLNGILWIYFPLKSNLKKDFVLDLKME